MDIIAHFLWTYFIYFNSKDVWIAVLLGILPDLIPFTPYLMIKAFEKEFNGTLSNLSKHKGDYVPEIVYKVYNSTHSLITFAALLIITSVAAGKIYIPMFAWLIHIIVDIPTHTKRFFPTKFLYPLSNYCISGWSWAEGWFMMLNYASLLLFAIIRIF